ncbi:hypothetical protein NPX13_g6776 [Xylaria arbuscula]|uniref:Protein NO VEIN C-terminal domain-containing protein n=1 Tax=Xylaria arbuscula TaxID=114810 RepID=A0A9W8NC81_9PEZI|nr:hypothetical protein NPX13_g6776 [Xylaria arbuscula]
MGKMSHCDDEVPLSEEGAKALVERIADEHGYVSEDVLRTMTPEARRVVERAFHMKDAMIGSSVITLSKNLYTSSARFVFEMLQNADDNSYSRARARHEEPYVAFNVSPRYITVECNEDGFTRKNLSAICSIGKSSKMGVQGYIGEKGIGFKSVFMAAYKVHIQSENFSFSFLHRRGDSGIGMISPVWEEWENRPPSGITRIKLFLIDNLDVETKVSEHPIMQQFREIQETYLLFMKNLRCVKVNFIDNHEKIISSATYSIKASPSGNRASLIRHKDGETQRINNYHVTKSLARNLPRNESREYSETELATESWSSSEVVLAFPLDDKGCAPEEVESQQVFAFLPIRNMGFKFLIQADWVTQANRQDIVTSSSRNQALRDGIADTFAEAMTQLCADDLLRYTWIRYLPVKSDYPWDEYWSGLYERIRSKVIATPLMHSFTETFPHKIEEVRKSKATDADEDGDPIFKNINPEKYLSKRYLKSELDKIHCYYGLKEMEYSEILMRASEDLNTPDSRMKSPTTGEEWHEKAARLLCYAFAEDERLKQTIEDLDVIPLENGEWIRAKHAHHQLSFPETDGGLSIPQDLPFSIISASASEGDYRSQLYSLLGAVRPSNTGVRQLIFDKYSALITRNVVFYGWDQPEISIGHLEFLYQTDGPSPVDTNQYQYVALLTERKDLVTPWSTDVYIANNHRYGAKTLLRSIENANCPEITIPGYPVHFLLSDYITSPTQKVAESKQDGTSIRSTDIWFNWLQERLGVLSHLRLFNDASELTDMFQWIINYRPEEILGLLQHQWPRIKDQVIHNAELKEKIANISVPCDGSPNLHLLSRSYLPTPELKSRFAQYVDDTDGFAFLNFDDTLAPHDLSAWSFLHDYFGVGKSDTLLFYLDVLDSVSRSKLKEPRKVFDLYQIIYGKVISWDDVAIGRELARSYFQDNALVMLPTDDSPRWEHTERCRWNAPRNMKSVSGLEDYYLSMYEENTALKSTLGPFMREIVGVRDLSWSDIVDELEQQRADGTGQDKEVIRQMYQLLANLELNLTEDQLLEVKDAFRSKELILAAGTWHTTETCIWSSATSIPGKVAINTDWPAMKTFFVNVLGVSTLTLSMVYEELQRKGTSESVTISEMKQELWQFNSLLAVAEEKPDASPILEGRVFPVRSPDEKVTLLSAKDNDFAIVDRKALGLKFENSAKLLDFAFDEVHRLRHFLEWAGLDERRLSVRVSEVTAPASNDGAVLEESERQIQPRAYALCRIATHMRSPRAQDPESFYRLLKSSTVLETDAIKSELHLREGDQILKVEQFQAELHIDTTEDTLHSEATVGIRDSEQAKRIIQSVLTANPSSLELLLEKEGIVELTFPEVEEEVVEEVVVNATGEVDYFSEMTFQQTSDNYYASDDEEEQDTPTVSEDDNATLVSDLDNTRQKKQTTASDESSEESSDDKNPSPETVSITPPSPEPAAFSQPSTPVPSRPGTPTGNGDRKDRGNRDDIDMRGSAYLTLLEKVISVARGACLPSKGNFDASAMKAKFSEVDTSLNEDHFKLRTARAIERDKMLGAAGELYVFELLSNANVGLSFPRTRWQSIIRTYVTVHSDYADMGPWTGIETADFVYTDFDSVLTTALIDNGYLNKEAWKGREPTYYIDVKTTTGVCETPFMMSKSQCKRMRTKSNGPGGKEKQDSIYVVFRVFNLGKSSMGCAIYVDPDAMRVKAALNFRAETWSVVPKQSS